MDSRTLECFARLGQYPEHDAFRVWLVQERDKTRDALETAKDETTLRLAQGRAMMLKDLQELMARAVSSVSKHRG